MNPSAIIQMLLQKNPALKNNMMVIQAIDKMQRGDTSGLQQLAENICKEKGLDVNKTINDVRSRFGI